MMTGVRRNQADAIWQRMWESGIANPTDVMSQIGHPVFIRQLDKRDSDAAHDVIHDTLERWRKLEIERERVRTEKSFLVPKDGPAKNDRSFSFNKYTETVYERIEYSPTEEMFASLEAIRQRIAEDHGKLQRMLAKEAE